MTYEVLDVTSDKSGAPYKALQLLLLLPENQPMPGWDPTGREPTSGNQELFVIADKTIIVATFEIVRESKEGAALEVISVSPVYQGKKLCKPLLQLVMKILMARGVSHFTVSIHSSYADGIPACLCYYRSARELGFDVFHGEKKLTSESVCMDRKTNQIDMDFVLPKQALVGAGARTMYATRCYKEMSGKKRLTKKDMEIIARCASSGEGLGDILGEAAARVKAALKGPREGPPPAVRKYLSDHGTGIVTKVQVCREPIRRGIDTALNLITFGGWKKSREKLGYDQMWHLYILLEMMMPNGQKHSAILERNQVVIIGDPKDKDYRAERCLDAKTPQKLSFAEFLYNGERLEPGGKWWVYDPFYNNCQDFVMTLLKGNDIDTPELTKFVKQDVKDLLPGYVEKFARKITDVAAIGDILVHGASFR